MSIRLGLVGGGLQGTEAACLARWAGWDSILVDARPQPPAKDLAQRFICRQLASCQDLDECFAGCDLVLPVCENPQTLELLSRWSQAGGGPLAFDPQAYQISSDKLLSNRLFEAAAVPFPRPWPRAEYPLIAKPAVSSGSRGVTLLEGPQDFQRLFPNGDTSGWVVEEYCPGPSYSLECTGRGGRHRAWLSTALEMDEIYDCRQVRAPAQLPPELEAEFRALSLRLAEAVRLRGLMDVEIIAAPQGLRVLEIDARLPSQTPTVVFWASGENLLLHLASAFIQLPRTPGETQSDDKGEPAVQRAVIYEHVFMEAEGPRACGEHIMASARPLSLRSNFFGADLALSDRQAGQADAWAATLIMMGSSLDEAYAKRDEVWTRLRMRQQ